MSYEANQIGDVSKDLLVDLLFKSKGADVSALRVRFPYRVQNKKPALTQKVKSGGGGNCLIPSPLRRNKKTCSSESLSVSSNLTCRSISRLWIKRPVSLNLTPSAKYPGTTGIHKQVVNR